MLFNYLLFFIVTLSLGGVAVSPLNATYEKTVELRDYRTSVNSVIEVKEKAHILKMSDEVAQSYYNGVCLGKYVKLRVRLVCAPLQNELYLRYSSKKQYTCLANEKVIVSIYNVTYSNLKCKENDAHFIVHRDFPLLVTEGKTDDKGFLEIEIWAPLWKEKVNNTLWVYPNTYYNITIILVREVEGSIMYYLIYNQTWIGSTLCTYLNGSVLPCEVYITRFLVKTMEGKRIPLACVYVYQKISNDEFLIWASTTNKSGYTDPFIACRYYINSLNYMRNKCLHIDSYQELSDIGAFRVVVTWRNIKVYDEHLSYQDFILGKDCIK